MVESQVHVDSSASLLVTATLLAGGVAASLLDRRPFTPAPAYQEARAHRKVTGLNVRSAQRAVVLAAGSTLLLAGALMVILPGPGMLTMLGGLALLATEFAWARLWLQRVKKRVRVLARPSRSDRQRRS